MIDCVKSLFKVNKDTAARSPLSRSVWIFSIVERKALFLPRFIRNPHCKLQKQLVFSRNLLSLWSIIFSIILLTFDKRETGLSLLQRSLDSVLKMSMTFVVFPILEKQPVEKNLLMSSERGIEILSLIK